MSSQTFELTGGVRLWIDKLPGSQSREDKCSKDVLFIINLM